ARRWNDGPQTPESIQSELRLRLVAAAAATAAAPTTAAVAAAAPAESAAAPTAAVGLGPGLVDGQGTAFDLGAVQRLDGRLRFLVGPHLHEAESLGPVRVPIDDHLSRHDAAVRLEHLLQVAVADAVGQVPHVQLLAHDGPPQKDCKRADATLARHPCHALAS